MALSLGFGARGVGVSADLGHSYNGNHGASIANAWSSITTWPASVPTPAEAAPGTWAEPATPSSEWQSSWTTLTSSWSTTTPPPPPPTTWTTSTCTGPIITEYEADAGYVYTPKPGVPALATHYIKTVSEGWGSSATTTTSVYCNTTVFEQYFRPSIFNCACGVGPFQTLDSNCNIVVGPIFTKGCDNNGYFVTQTGPSGTVVDLTAVATTSCGVVSTSPISVILTNAPTATSTPMLRNRKRATVSVDGTVANVNTLTSAQGALTVSA